MESANKEKYEQFLEHFQAHRKSLYTFIFALVANAADTEDLFQEMCIVLWRKFDQFQAGTNFRAWAKQIGRNLIMDYQKRHKRRPVTRLDNEMISLLAFRYEPIQNEAEARLDALKTCIDKLSFRDRSLIEKAYQRGESVKRIANETEVSVQRIYKRLGTIHGTLLRCVRATLHN